MDVAGLSYGGWIAAEHARRHPERVRRLVLLAPAGLLAPLPFGFVWRAVLTALPGRFFLRRFVAWVAPELTGDPAHSRRFSEMMDDIDEARRAFAPRRMIAPMPFPDDAWATLAGKTLLLAGEAEVIFSAPAELARLARVAPGVESHLLPGAGHDFFVARADEVNARIVAHLSAPGA
jgi:pimeloyl-ACP methyl ester carboxylesterase